MPAPSSYGLKSLVNQIFFPLSASPLKLLGRGFRILFNALIWGQD